MNLEKLISLLDENDEVGKNNATADPQIVIANMKLRKSGLGEIPQDFALLLKKYNGLSCNGNVIFGIDTKTMFFPDLIEFNENNTKDEKIDGIILGQDEDSFLVYNREFQNYRIIDKDNYEEKVCTDDLIYAIAWILKI